MKPPPFTYHAPEDLDEALEILARTEGKVLAGGQSLIPLLNMRLAAPADVVDINRLAELDTLDVSDEGVRVGALARHARVERDEAAYAVQPLLRQALRLVAHPVIRNRGTVAGSIVHADPASEMPAVLSLLDGSVRLARRGPDGPVHRTVEAAHFFAGPLESAARPGELATEVFFPAVRGGTAFKETARRHGDYALAGVAALVTLDEDLRVEGARVACIGVGPVPEVHDLTETCGGRSRSVVDWALVAGVVKDRVEPEDDIHATAEYRSHLVGVLAERALREAAEAAI